MQLSSSSSARLKTPDQGRGIFTSARLHDAVGSTVDPQFTAVSGNMVKSLNG
ncbi:hypothetical protein QTP88_014027 [Uroleucon formosanum]